MLGNQDLTLFRKARKPILVELIFDLDAQSRTGKSAVLSRKAKIKLKQMNQFTVWSLDSRVCSVAGPKERSRRMMVYSRHSSLYGY